MGRKNKELTEEQKAQLEVMSRFLTVDQIADILGISRTTFYEIIKRDPEIDGFYKKGRANQILKFASNLSKQSDMGNAAATIFALKTQAGWKETQRIEGVGDDGEHIIAYKWLDDDNEDNSVQTKKIS